MNYYYDIKLNYQKDNCLFYEWSSLDKIETINKIPIIKISNNDMYNILTNHIKIDISSINNKKEILFVSKNNAIALLFNQDGEEMYRSNILLDDEVNVIEECDCFKINNIKYEVIKHIKYNEVSRKETIIKNVIKKEIQYLINNKNYQKLEYLYMEWFDKKSSNYKIMESDIYTRLDNVIGDKEINIYNLIMLSYKKV